MINALEALALSKEYTDEQKMNGSNNVLPNELSSSTKNGVTVTVNDDGSTIFDTGDGTATSASSFKFYSAKGSELQHLNGMIISGLTSGASGKCSMRISMRNSPWTTYVSVLTEPKIINGIPNTNDIIDIDLYVYAGAKLNKITVYPMISFDDGPYAPYNKTNTELIKKIQGLINAVNNSADYAEFKTAVASL